MKKCENTKKREVGMHYRLKRVALRMSQSQLANQLQVSQMIISDIENGKKQSPRIMRLLDNFYEVNTNNIQ